MMFSFAKGPETWNLSYAKTSETEPK
jgi:hypothetical protein